MPEHPPGPLGPFVIGTAGHVDHGKTRLVEALTGVSTDRLEEERRRGVSIELGFAPWSTASFEASIVDVPGHEDFVRTMVGGAGGVDIVLLVVAADEGVMPQTREHAHICALLGVKRAIVVLTKSDRVDDEELELAREDVRAQLPDPPFAEAPIVVTAAPPDGEPVGLDALRDSVASIARTLPRRRADGPALVQVDRAFSVRGRGSVVTGTLLAGSIRVGDTLRHVPADFTQAEGTGTVRGLHVRNRAIDRIEAGERAAINLADVALADLHRGDVLCSEARVIRSDTIHVWAKHLPHGSRPWRSASTVLLCAGATHAIARLFPLAPETLASGGVGLVRMRLDRPVPTWRGMTVILRRFEDAPETHRFGKTVGGARVVDPQPQAGRGLRRRWTELGLALRAEAWEARARALVDDAGVRPIAAAEVDRRAAEPGTAVRDAGDLDAVARVDGGLCSETVLDELAAQIVAGVKARPGVAAAAVATSSAAATPRVVQHAVHRALARGEIERDRSDRLYPAGHGPLERHALPPGLDAMMQALEAGGLAPPTLKQLAASLERTPTEVAAGLGRLAGAELAVRLADGLTMARTHRDRLLHRVAGHFDNQQRLDLQTFKAMTAVSRKFAVPLLQHLDEIGATLRRRGEDDVRSRGPKLAELVKRAASQ